MRLAPLGVLALMAFTVGKYGLTMLIHLAKLILSFYAALAVFLAIVLWGAVQLTGIDILALLSFWFSRLWPEILMEMSGRTSRVAGRKPLITKRLWPG